ncbi:hypothetical protein ACTU44_09805 [Thalassospira sp. SM2505]
MSMHKTAKCLTMIAMGFALSGCLLDAKEPVTVANESQTLVTPWGAPSSTRSTATSSSDSNLVMMEDANRKALDQIQQKQIDEARIALGILDRMAKRCVQDGDAAACATLQTNWAPLSQQLHKTLSMMAGDSMQMPMTDPSNDPAMAPANDSPPRPPAPATSAPAGDSDTPTMEKIIPMSSSGSDG